MEGSATAPRRIVKKKSDPFRSFKANFDQSLATIRLGYHPRTLKAMVTELNQQITRFLKHGLTGLPEEMLRTRLLLSIKPCVPWVIRDADDPNRLLEMRNTFEALFFNVQASKSVSLRNRFNRVFLDPAAKPSESPDVLGPRTEPKQLFDRIICARVMEIFVDRPDLLPVCNTIGHATGNKHADQPYAVYLRISWAPELST